MNDPISETADFMFETINPPSNLVGQVFQIPLSVEMYWTDNSNNEDGFIIERETLTGDAYVIIDSVNQNVTSYIDTNLAYLTYNYRVKAFNSVSQSAYSDTLQIIVPVELTSFIAKPLKTEILLEWSTSSEKNNHGFDIERNSGENYTVIGFVSGHGTTTEIKNYFFSDKNLQAGTYKYRLKQIDYNGTSRYSEEVIAELTAPLTFNLGQNYPNPFNTSTRISFEIPNTSNVKLVVFDLLGKEVITLVDEEKKAGYYEIIFDASALSSGTYYYKIISNGFSKTKKMVLLK